MDRTNRQKEAVNKWISNRCVGCVVMPTGVGKSRIGLMAIKRLTDKYPELTSLVIVPTENLKQQWEVQIKEWNLNTDVLIINTALKEKRKYDILILDESHMYASDQRIDIFKIIKYRFILALTATNERLDGRHVLMEKYCPVIDSMTTQEAIDNGWISQYKEYEVLIDVDDIDVYKSFNKDFVRCFESFQFDFNVAMRCLGPNGYKVRMEMAKKKYPTNSSKQKDYYNVLTANAMGFMKTMQKRKAFINNHPMKIEIANRIIEARQDKKIITFSNNISMAKKIKYGYLYAGKSDDINPEEFSKMECGVLNTCKKCVVGSDIDGLSVAIMLGIDSSHTRNVQSRGRAIRFKEGKTAEIFNIIINNTVECNWMEKSHVNEPYEVIDIEGLNNILNYEERCKYYGKPVRQIFRY